MNRTPFTHEEEQLVSCILGGLMAANSIERDAVQEGGTYGCFYKALQTFIRNRVAGKVLPPDTLAWSDDGRLWAEGTVVARRAMMFYTWDHSDPGVFWEQALEPALQETCMRDLEEDINGSFYIDVCPIREHVRAKILIHHSPMGLKSFDPLAKDAVY